MSRKGRPMRTAASSKPYRASDRRLGSGIVMQMVAAGAIGMDISVGAQTGGDGRRGKNASLTSNGKQHGDFALFSESATNNIGASENCRFSPRGKSPPLGHPQLLVFAPFSRAGRKGGFFLFSPRA